jgi:hypothetical protein
MKYIEAPEKYLENERSLFLAGGITGCKNWQSEMSKMLKDENFVLLNPRRKEFMGGKDTEKEQISWEFEHLRKASAILFWFPDETSCPITLYELGAWSMTNKTIFVGVNPNYKRKSDVEIQTKLARSDIKIVYSLEDLSQQVKLWLKEKN